MLLKRALLFLLYETLLNTPSYIYFHPDMQPPPPPPPVEPEAPPAPAVPPAQTAVQDEGVVAIALYE